MFLELPAWQLTQNSRGWLPQNEWDASSWLITTQYPGPSMTNATKARREAALGRVPWTWQESQTLKHQDTVRIIKIHHQLCHEHTPQMKMTTISWLWPSKAFCYICFSLTVAVSANSTASAISAKCEVSRWRAPSLRRTRKCNPSCFPALSVEKINRWSHQWLLQQYLTCVGVQCFGGTGSGFWTWRVCSFPVALWTLPRDGPPPKRAPIQPVACILATRWSIRWLATLFKHERLRRSDNMKSPAMFTRLLTLSPLPLQVTKAHGPSHTHRTITAPRLQNALCCVVSWIPWRKHQADSPTSDRPGSQRIDLHQPFRVQSSLCSFWAPNGTHGAAATALAAASASSAKMRKPRWAWLGPKFSATENWQNSLRKHTNTSLEKAELPQLLPSFPRFRI